VFSKLGKLVVSTLFIVATPIGNLSDMSPRAIEVLRAVDVIAAEDTRHSGKLLRAFDIDTPMISYHHHNRVERAEVLLQRLARGDVALISDAGTPAIADPGHELVAAAAAAGHRVVPIPGPSSLVAAVSASGLVPGPFVFLGFLPRSGQDRRRALGTAIASGFPLVLFESPLRAADTLREIEGLSPGRLALVARELTKLHEEIVRGTVAGLAEQFARHPPRGEVVIVVGEAADPIGDAREEDAVRLVRAILERGIKPSKAAREISSILGLDGNDAYDLVQRVARERREE